MYQERFCTFLYTFNQCQFNATLLNKSFDIFEKINV